MRGRVTDASAVCVTMTNAPVDPICPTCGHPASDHGGKYGCTHPADAPPPRYPNSACPCMAPEADVIRAALTAAQAELKTLSEQYWKVNAHRGELSDEIVALRASRDALARDAERLQGALDQMLSRGDQALLFALDAARSAAPTTEGTKDAD